MTQVKFPCMTYAEISTRLDISILSDVTELVGHLAVHAGRVAVGSLTHFMSFWDRFRRKPKDEESGEDEEQKKKKRRRWGVFHGTGHVTGGTNRSRPIGGFHHRHHGGIGGIGFGHTHSGGIGG